MRKVTKYIANDGKEFDSRFECKLYESGKEIDALDAGELVFRIDGISIPKQCLCEDIDKANIIQVNSERALETLRNLDNVFETDICIDVCKPGTWVCADSKILIGNVNDISFGISANGYRRSCDWVRFEDIIQYCNGLCAKIQSQVCDEEQ